MSASYKAGWNAVWAELREPLSAAFAEVAKLEAA
jgi:hypothetical protein